MSVTSPSVPAAPVAEREARLTESLRKLRTGAGNGQFDRILLTLGAVLLPLGVMLILLGWYGASHTTLEFEQNSYLISGGILGLALVVVGGFIYFGFWIMRLAREMRTQSEAVTDALAKIEEALAENRMAAQATPERPLRSRNGRVSAKS